MSAQTEKRLQIGAIDCGGTMNRTPWWVHIFGLVVMSMVMLFSYAALLENGIWPAITGFIFGFGFLLLIYGHHFDQFYIHVGDRFKVGGESYDPDGLVRVEIDDENER